MSQVLNPSVVREEAGQGIIDYRSYPLLKIEKLRLGERKEHSEVLGRARTLALSLKQFWPNSWVTDPPLPPPAWDILTRSA